MTMRPAALLLALALAACTGANGTTGVTSSVTKPVQSSAKPSAGGTAKPGATGTPSPGGGATTKPDAAAIANDGTFTWAGGQTSRYERKEATSLGPTTTALTLAITAVEAGKASFKVTSAPPGGGAEQERAQGVFDVATGNPYWGFVDLNLKSEDVLAAAKAEGEETVTVPAGTYVCTKTRYQKTTAPGADVDVTLWTNAEAGLVKAKVANTLSVGAISQTSDVEVALTEAP
jgi:hypothetical protein